ncbi:S8 family peptidase [bacterium]|nr:S8 family peptidase [bacterium]
MAESFNKPHLRIQGFSTSEPYKYPRKVVDSIQRNAVNRTEHGNRLLTQFNQIKSKFDLGKEVELPDVELLKDDVIYVQFFSAWGFSFDFDQFTDNHASKNYTLLNIQVEKNTEGKERFKILVSLKEGGISSFLKKIEDYLNPEKDLKSKKPKNDKLLVNIDEIKEATIKAFWTDGGSHEFPRFMENVWWEVWFRKAEFDADKVKFQLEKIGATIGDSKLEFAENFVWLVKATSKQLTNSVYLLDSLSELRKPQVLNDFITHEDVTYDDQAEWMKDLVARTSFENPTNGEKVLVSLFDSGVNNVHPLLKNIVPDAHLETWKYDWGRFDTEPNGGHGTGMAGLALYGNLTDALATSENIIIYHGVESFKICDPSEKTDPKLFGVIYQDGCNSLIISRPNNNRVFCLSVTNDGIIEGGRPSSSSSALDKLIYENKIEPKDAQLFIVSGGNVNINSVEEYPDVNFISSIQDPGQAYNAITVGACTLLDKLSDSVYSPLAKHGAMSPFNTTSGAWETQWPNKPDIVFEGGNSAVHPTGFVGSHDELSPISLHSDFSKNLFLPFNGTSSAAALAAKMMAELRTVYPDYWAETIRGLLIHSADWTEAMLEGRDIGLKSDRRALLRSIGYGVPNLFKAINSANNSLTLIAEEEIQPYHKVKSDIKTNEYHLFELPWPKDILLNEVAENDAKITITLSYFIEPNPGNKQYSRSFYYHSHELDYKLIKAGESLDVFKRRISSAYADESEERPDTTSEEWVIRESLRSKGSIKKDFYNTSGAELSNRFYLAVYPKNGWYRSRKKLNKFDSKVKYSLIITIETVKMDVDIYSPIETLIKTTIPITT